MNNRCKFNAQEYNLQARFVDTSGNVASKQQNSGLVLLTIFFQIHDQNDASYRFVRAAKALFRFS